MRGKAVPVTSALLERTHLENAKIVVLIPHHSYLGKMISQINTTRLNKCTFK